MQKGFSPFFPRSRRRSKDSFKESRRRARARSQFESRRRWRFLPRSQGWARPACARLSMPLRRTNLLVLRRLEGEEIQVDLPHECLEWKWQRLKQWIDQEAALAKS